MNVEKKLATFSKIIEEEANAKRQATLHEIDTKLNTTLEDFKAKAEAEARAKIDAEKTAADRLVKREISMYSNDRKKTLLAKRTELEDKLFESARTKLVEYTKSEEYKENLIKFVENEMNNGPCEIIVSKSDYERFFAGEQWASIISSGNDNFIGGYKVVLKDRGRIIDNTYKLKLDDAKENFKGLKAYI